MSDKSLLERLQADAKRHRAPQVDILPEWVKVPVSKVVLAQPIIPEDGKRAEKARKTEKLEKPEKKAKKKKK